MGVRFTSEVEQERVKKNFNSKQWEYLITNSLVKAANFAKEKGWAENKVQVRIVNQISEDLFEYAVEPYEHDCKCPNLLRYDDYFIRTDESIVQDKE